MRRHLPALAAVLLAAAPLMVTTAPADARRAPAPESPAVALAWQRIAHRTVYTQGGTAQPVGVLYLAFTSRAMHDAADASLERRGTSATAAVATAAHDVLATYFPAFVPNLDADLATTLAAVPDGVGETRGIRVGRAAAAAVVADRADDGRNDATILYDKARGVVGIWEAPPTGMLAPWLGYVDPLVVGHRVAVDGPDAVGSPAYRSDLEEVRAIGRGGEPATEEQRARQASARFFGTGSAIIAYRNAVIDHLATAPIGLGRTTQLFAQADAAMADAAIQAWRIKREVGFWRPVEGLTRDDGDPLTTPEPGWASVLPTPPYPDYLSGHGVITSAFMGVTRCWFGDGLDLTLTNVGVTRSFGSLSAIEAEALESRIWAGIHFRDAMDDAYMLGHEIAARVARSRC